MFSDWRELNFVSQLRARLRVSIIFIGNDSEAIIEVREEKNRSAWSVHTFQRKEERTKLRYVLYKQLLT